MIAAIAGGGGRTIAESARRGRRRLSRASRAYHERGAVARLELANRLLDVLKVGLVDDQMLEAPQPGVGRPKIIEEAAGRGAAPRQIPSDSARPD